MKRTILVVLLLSIPSIFADSSFESTKAALDNQQAAVDSAERRVAELKTQLEAGTAQLASAAGKPENASEIDRLNESNRRLVDECNQAVAACKAENKRLQEVVATCTGGDRQVVSEGGKYSLHPHEPKEAPSRPAPVVRTSTPQSSQVEAPRTQRAPYARQGRMYPRASETYSVVAE